jgi:hypothetical protein
VYERCYGYDLSDFLSQFHLEVTTVFTEWLRLIEFNPEMYLRHVLTVVVDHPVNQVAELLSWNLQLDAN